MSSKRYQEFKIAAVKQVTDSGYSVPDVAQCLGVSQPKLYEWIEKYSPPEPERLEQQSQSAEIRRLKAELKRVIEERDIRNRPQRTLPKSSSKVRIHRIGRVPVPGSPALSHDVGAITPRMAILPQREARKIGIGSGV